MASVQGGCPRRAPAGRPGSYAEPATRPGLWNPRKYDRSESHTCDIHRTHAGSAGEDNKDPGVPVWCGSEHHHFPHQQSMKIITGDDPVHAGCAEQRRPRRIYRREETTPGLPKCGDHHAESLPPARLPPPLHWKPNVFRHNAVYYARPRALPTPTHTPPTSPTPPPLLPRGQYRPPAKSSSPRRGTPCDRSPRCAGSARHTRGRTGPQAPAPSAASPRR